MLNALEESNFHKRIMKINDFSFLILSRQEACALKLNMPYVLISVNEPNSGEIVFEPDANRIEILRLKFNDVFNKENTNSTLMSRSDAHNIIDFVSKHSSTDLIYVIHCTMGVSRSPAIAAAIAATKGYDIRTFWTNFLPNSHVFGTIMSCYAVQQANLEKQQKDVI